MVNLTPPTQQTIIFSDLDGTLLDHNSYEIDPAKATLSKLVERNIPIIFATSKTRAELNNLKSYFGFFHGAIIENGAALEIGEHSLLNHLRSNSPIVLSKNIKTISKVIDTMPLTLRGSIRTIFDYSLNDICALTNLSQENMKLALTREYSLPFVYLGNDLPEIVTYVREMGLDITKGGRFYHLIERSVKKSLAISWLIDNLKRQCSNKQFTTIAIGDGENDLCMFEVVDKSILIPNKATQIDKKKLAGLNYIQAKDEGPKGWASAVEKIIFKREEK